MRHRKSGVKLNRTTSHRQAMFRNMVTSLLKHDRIKTTDVKAKELRRWVDHIITLAKRGDLNARRQVLAIVREKAVVHKIFAEANDRFGKINGGYTRIVKIGRRPGDAAPVSMIELVSAEDEAKKKKKKTAAKRKTDASQPAAPAKTDEAEAAAPQKEAEPAPPAEEPAQAAADDSVEKADEEVSEAPKPGAEAASASAEDDVVEDEAPAAEDDDASEESDKKSE